MHDLITCESKVQVVVALGRHEVLFEVLTLVLQSENVFELGGITMQVVALLTTAKKWTKMKNARAERAKLLFLSTKYANL